MLATLVLAGCGAEDAAPVASRAPPAEKPLAPVPPLPDMAAVSARLEVKTNYAAPYGPMLDLIVYKSGAKYRTEYIGANTATVYDTVNRSAWMLAFDNGKPVITYPAFRLLPSPTGGLANDPGKAKRISACSGSNGETGWEYQYIDPRDAGVKKFACVSADGIILRLKRGEVIVWETIKNQLGPQLPELFQEPAP